MAKPMRQMQNGSELIEACDPDKEEWRVIIETPKGSRNKYKYADDFCCFQLAKVLPEGMVFPFDFGFLPCTMGADGDPLDVLLLMDQPTFCGCLILSRLIGVIEAQQTEKDGTTERNDRLVAVPLESRNYGKVRSLKDLDKQMLDEIERFFHSYNEQSGKQFKLVGFHGPHRSESLAQEGMKQFAKQHRSRRRNSKSDSKTRRQKVSAS
jgi:inorganic pyrophosphatase